MKVLITGITGFAGSHLADYLLENQPEAEVAGMEALREIDPAGYRTKTRGLPPGEALLEEWGFDREQHEQIRSDLRDSSLSDVDVAGCHVTVADDGGVDDQNRFHETSHPAAKG